MDPVASVYDIISNFPFLIGKYRDVPALLALPCVAFSMPFVARRIGRSSRWLIAAAVAVACIVALVMLGSSAAYLAGTGYLDHVEPSIAAVSWWYHTGHPMYPDLAGDDGVYGFAYGPLLFQITAAALSLGPSILLSKLPGFFSFWLACAVVMGSFRPLLPSLAQRLLPAVALILMAGGYWRAAYWVRSEPYLLLIAAAALFSWRRLDRTAAAVAIGLLAGGSMNLKIHGCLYILPYAVALLVSAGSTPARARIAMIGIVSGMLALVLPFLDPNVSPRNYASFLGLALHHGLDRRLLLLNIRFSLVLLLPALFVCWRQLRGRSEPDLPMVLAYGLCVAVVCVIGGKRGAGPTHLLPFLPAFVYLLVRVAQSATGPGDRTASTAGLAICFLAVAVAYLPSFVSNLFSLRAWVRVTDNPALRQEAARFYAEYPTAVMGAGNDASFVRTEYKALGVFAGGPLAFDASTWMDLQGAGVPDDVLTRLLTGCRTRYWIIPNGGEPFTQRSAYNQDLLFSDQFRALFHHRYRPVQAGEFYSVWGCRDVSPADPP